MRGTSRNLKEHTADEWEALRPRLTELYLRERRRLADVSRILREEKSFHATDKQYKDRIRKWGLRKNFKDSEKREALLTGVDPQSGDHVATEGAIIPPHRLKRFARDSRLLYVRRMAAGTTLPPEPQSDSTIVIELPRRVFEVPSTGDLGTLHESFAAIDRLSKKRWPVLSFEVLGVSDAVVRYGIRRLERKIVPGMDFEMLPASDLPGNERGPGIRFCTSVCAARAAYQAPEELENHMALFHAMNLSLYKACQTVYLRKTWDNGRAASSHAGQPSESRCMRFNASPLAAQRLYLRLLIESSLAGSLRYADPVSEAEFLSSPSVGAAMRFSVGPEQDLIFTFRQSLNVSMHALKRGSVIAGAYAFRPGYEARPISGAGGFEQEAVRLRAVLSRPIGQALGSNFLQKIASGLQRTPEQFLTDGDPPEEDFRETSERAALKTEENSQAGVGVAYALIENPMNEADASPGPQRQWARLIATECIVDRDEPWKLAQVEQLPGGVPRADGLGCDE